MNWEQFRALETFAILYDIQIDEEEYDEGACRVLFSRRPRALRNRELYDEWQGPSSRTRPWEANMCVAAKSLSDLAVSVSGAYVARPSFPENRLPGWTIPRFALPELSGPSPIKRYWRVLLAAKRQRAAFMCSGNTASDDALTDLGAEVLGELPPNRALGFPTRREDVSCLRDALRSHPHHGRVAEPVQLLLLWVLLQMEAAQCYRGSHSMAHAVEADKVMRQALEALLSDELNERELNGQSPYQLVARYNRGMGENHAKQYDEALRSLGAVAGDAGFGSRDARPAPCFVSAEGWLIHLRWLMDGKHLYRSFVGVPAMLQAADTLNKMQRSAEALECLDHLGDDILTPYQRTRRDLLRARIGNDLRNPNATRSSSIVVEQRHLRQYGQWLSVAIEESGRDVLSKMKKAGDRPGSASIQTTALMKLLRRRVRCSPSDRSELDQSINLWAKELHEIAEELERLGRSTDVTEGLPGLLRLFALKLPVEARWAVTGTKPGARVNSFAWAALDVVNDLRYRDYKSETREALFEAVWILCKLTLGLFGHQSAEKCCPPERLLLREYAFALFAAVAELHSTSEYHRHLALTRLSVLRGECLPPPDGDRAQRRLRSFVLSNFVSADPSALPCRKRRLVSGKPNLSSAWCPREYRCLDGPCPSSARLWSHSKSVRRNEHGEHIIYCDSLSVANMERIESRVKSGGKRPRTPSGWGLAVLQRWNSFTPAFGSSEGGGYMLFRGQPQDASLTVDTNETKRRNLDKKKIAHSDAFFGLAIDPGYGFVKNLLAERFGVIDISAVAVTHDHSDHLADFEALHNLMFEANHKDLDLLVSEGAHKRLESIIKTSPVIRTTTIMAPDRGASALPTDPRNHHKLICKYYEGVNIDVWARRALHAEVSLKSSHKGYDSIGLFVKIEEPSKTFCVGFPSDTVWCDESVSDYSGAAVICLHLGSLTKRKGHILDFLHGHELDEVLEAANHLLLAGSYWFIESLAKIKGAGENSLVVLSEFGEELSGGLRIMIASALDGCAHNVRVLPGDVGLLVDPVTREVQCSCCDCFYPWATTEFEYEVFGESEQIFYLCPSCHGGLSWDQKAAVFRRRQVPLTRAILDG